MQRSCRSKPPVERPAPHRDIPRMCRDRPRRTCNRGMCRCRLRHTDNRGSCTPWRTRCLPDSCLGSTQPSGSIRSCSRRGHPLHSSNVRACSGHTYSWDNGTRRFFGTAFRIGHCQKRSSRPSPAKIPHKWPLQTNVDSFFISSSYLGSLKWSKTKTLASTSPGKPRNTERTPLQRKIEGLKRTPRPVIISATDIEELRIM